MKRLVTLMKSFLANKGSKKDFAHNTSIAGLIYGLLLVAFPLDALAFDIPFISGFACDAIKYMTGPLAVIVFLVVAVVTLIVGLMAKMDWAKMLAVVIVFGLIQGLVALLKSSGQIQLPACL